MRDLKIQTLVKTALMMALVYIFTTMFKIPTPLTGGYTHLGDCMIFLAVMILGRKQGTIAAGFGAALADLLGGYVVYVVPTLIIKSIMAFIMGTFVEKLIPKNKINWLFGAVAGGLFQVFGYAVLEVFLYGFAASLATVPANLGQTFTGIVMAAVIIFALSKAHVLDKLKERQVS